MPVTAWIVGGVGAVGVIGAVLWALVRLAGGRAEAVARAKSDHAALSTAEKVIDVQARPAPDDAELDGFLRGKREGA